MTGIRHLGYFIAVKRGVEAGPAGVRLKFSVGSEQHAPACGAEINSFLMIVPILIFIWRLCFRLAQDLKLRGTQNLPPLGIAQRDLLRHWGRLDLPVDSSGFPVSCNAQSERQDAEQNQEQRFHSYQV